MNNTTSHQGRLKSLRAAGIGNALEWFDWTLYATFSVYLAGNLFDKACQCIRADQAFDSAKTSCSEERQRMAESCPLKTATSSAVSRSNQ